MALLVLRSRISRTGNSKKYAEASSSMSSIDIAIAKYADLVAPWGVDAIRRDAEMFFHQDIGQGYKRLKNNRGQPCDKSKGWYGLKGACERKKRAEVEDQPNDNKRTKAAKAKLRQSIAKESAVKLAQKIRAEKVKAISGSSDDVDTSPVFKQLREAENKIREQRYETLKVFSQDGKELVSLDGSESEVVIPHDKYPLFKDAIFTHNHPSGWKFEESSPQSGGKSFSDEDLVTAAGLDVKEVRAISRGFIYSMKRPKDGWPKYEEVRNDLANIEEEVQSFFWPKINAAKTDEEQKKEIDKAESLHHHMKSEKLAAKIGATYTRKPWSDRR